MNNTNTPDKNVEQATAVSKDQNDDVVLKPLTDIHETKEGVVLYADLPGVSKENLDIDIDQNVLTIKGVISLQTDEKMEPTYMDVKSKTFQRQFTLGEEMDSSRIEANLKQGVLELTIPRQEQHKPKKINITVK